MNGKKIRNKTVVLTITGLILGLLFMGAYVADIAGALRVLALLAFILFFNTGSLGVVLWLSSTRKGKIDECGKAYQKSPKLCFWLGVIILLIGFVIIMILGGIAGNAGEFFALIFIGLIITVIGYLLYWMLHGKALFYQLLASRFEIEESVEEKLPELSEMFKAGLIIESATLLPIAGQLVTIYMLLSGLGAYHISGKFQSKIARNKEFRKRVKELKKEFEQEVESEPKVVENSDDKSE